MRQWTRAQLLTAGGILGTVAAFAVLAYARRWIADDGLIVVRIVRQILAGNGPVFNVAERVEGNTSTLWPWLLALATLVSRANPAYVAVVVGWLCSVAALAITADATRRWHRARGSASTLVPLGALVPLGVFAFWDYATSGLESSLCLLWIASCWSLLISLRTQPSPRRELACALVFGLGPLVRPDFALVSAVFLVGAWLLARPPRKRTLLLALAAIALPVAYEVFRAGYYGMLVPNPALTKSASASAWARGVAYLFDFIRPYRMWRIIPLFVLVAVLYRSRVVARDRIIALVPVAAAALLALYVVRVGGDFMHGRMLLPVAFLALAPVALVPLRRPTAACSALVLVWAIYTAIHVGDGRVHTRSDDERHGYVALTKHDHPIDPALFVHAAYNEGALAAALAAGKVVTEGGVVLARAPGAQGSVVIAGRLGAGGAAAPLDVYVADTLGLVHPIGSRITPTFPAERPGHQKVLPWSWLLGQFVDPATDASAQFATTPDEVRAARHALSCGDLAELHAAVRAPLTPSRFWANLVGAVHRTRLVIPSDPRDAEHRFCRD